MAPTREKSVDYLERYSRFVEGEEIRLISFTPRQIRWRRKRVRGLYFSNGTMKERWFPFPDAIYNQCYNIKAPKITAHIGSRKVFNRINRFNKWQIHNILESASEFDFHNVIPETRLLSNVNLLVFLDKHDTVFIKPCYGSFGNGIFRIRFDKENQKYHIYTIVTTPKYSYDNPTMLYKKIKELVGRKKFIIQSEIPMKTLNNDLFDIRMIVQKNESGRWSVTTAFSRITPHRSILTNNMYKKMFLHELLSALQYAPEKQQDIMNDLYKTSINTAKTLEQKLGHLGEMSVDFTITDQDELKIIEVNGKPSKALIDELSDDNIIDLFYSNPIKYLKFLGEK